MELHRLWRIAVLVAFGLGTCSCVGGGVFFKQRLTGNFALWAVAGLAGNSLVEESADGNSTTVLVGPTVYSAGFNADFIVVARHPERH